MFTFQKVNVNCWFLSFFACRRKKDLEGDVYNFGFILLESLVGPIVSGKGETFLLSEMVCILRLMLPRI